MLAQAKRPKARRKRREGGREEELEELKPWGGEPFYKKTL